MADKNASKRDVVQQAENDHPERQSAAGNMYAEVDFGKPKQGGAKVEVADKGKDKSEAEYLKSAPKDLRRELGLREDATSDQVYHKMAHDMVGMWPKASPDLKREALQTLGLQRGGVTEANVYDAFIRRDRRETGTPDSASLSELETAVHKRTYKQIKNGTLPIDYD
jgi:hypothetical protein